MHPTCKQIVLGLVTALAFTGAAAAHEGAKPKRVPLPTMTIEQGEKCVEPTDVMRREHMQFILHQRDETMHRGIRTSKHSFKNCVNCHAAKSGSVLGKDGFCASCHSYAAVSVDCFSCHTDKPEPVAATPEAVPTAAVKPAKPAAKGTKR